MDVVPEDRSIRSLVTHYALGAANGRAMVPSSNMAMQRLPAEWLVVGP